MAEMGDVSKPAGYPPFFNVGVISSSLVNVSEELPKECLLFSLSKKICK